MINLSMSNKRKISIIWWYFSFFFWAIFIINPNININASLNIFCIFETNLESSVTEPLDINFTFQIIKLERHGLQSLHHLHLLLFSCLNLGILFWGHAWWKSYLVSRRTLWCCTVARCVDHRVEIGHIRYGVF